MKQRTSAIIKWSFLTACVIIAFLHIKITLQPELHYHVQQPAFLLNRGFFATFLKFPGGIAKYMANFLTQFFCYPWAGPFVILAVGLLMMLAVYSIIKSRDDSAYAFYLMYIPLILFIALLNNYYFPFVAAVRILFVIMALWLLVFLFKKGVHPVASFFILAVIIYYLAGSGSLLVFSVTAILLFPYKKFKLKTGLFFIFFAACCTWLTDFIAYRYVFALFPENAWFSFFLEADVYLDAFVNYKPGLLFYLFCFSLPFTGLILFLKSQLFTHADHKQSNRFAAFLNSKAILIHGLIIAVITGISFLLISATFDKHKKNIALADYYCYHEQWKDVIDVALSDPQYDVFINYHFNRAIDNAGKFTDLFFSYPQYRVFALYPDRVTRGNPGLAHIISDYYFDLGYISISQQWAHAALALMPYNPRVIKRLVITHLIYGNYNAAEGFLNNLSGNFVSRDFVKRYMPYTIDTTLAAKDNLLMEKRKCMPQRAVISDDLTERLQELLARNKDNKRAYEHLQMCYLLLQNLDYFVINLEGSKQYYEQLPGLFEQAYLTHLFVEDIQDQSAFTISKNSRETFTGFIETLRPYTDDRELAMKKLNRYSGTYMYYGFFYGPPDHIGEINTTKDY